MSSLSEQMKARQELRDRQYRQQDKEYLEKRTATLAKELSQVEQQLADTQARLDRLEEIIRLNETFHAS